MDHRSHFNNFRPGAEHYKKFSFLHCYAGQNKTSRLFLAVSKDKSCLLSAYNRMYHLLSCINQVR